jgi:hypothetical protein
MKINMSILSTLALLVKNIKKNYSEFVFDNFAPAFHQFSIVFTKKFSIKNKEQS